MSLFILRPYIYIYRNLVTDNAEIVHGWEVDVKIYKFGYFSSSPLAISVNSNIYIYIYIYWSQAI